MTFEIEASRYSEALEQQLALVHHLLSPLGPSLLQDAAEELLAGSDRGKDAGWRAQILAGEVSHARPFFWTAPIARAIREAIETIPAYTFTEDGFPCPIGFVWFEKPVPLDQGKTATQGLQAKSWRVGPRPSGDGVIALLNGWLETSRRPGPVLRVRESVDMGWTLEQVQPAVGDTLKITHGAVEPPSGEAALVDVFLRFVAGCLSFLEQRIVAAERRPASRPLRRRLERERYGGETTIGSSRCVGASTSGRIQIPLAATATGSTSGSCRGTRRQYYPKSNAHKPRYIAPYVKGPADKPLKAPAGSVFVVTR